MTFATKMVKYSIKNISGNNEAVFFKLGTKIVLQQQQQQQQQQQYL